MRASRRLLLAALACVAICTVSAFAAAQSDEAIAERVLGPHWKQLSRRAGMVFAGTVLSSGTRTPATDRTRTDRTVPAIELRFRVDRPIAGVEAGQVLTIHEWAGAEPLHRPMRCGEHILIFLYPPSRLGLTSPVGGSLGQIALDASGTNVAPGAAASRVSTQNVWAERKLAMPSGAQNDQSARLSPAARKAANVPITVVQLERAIRAARGE